MLHLLILVLVETMSKKFHGLCAKVFANSSKDLYFSTFHNGNKNMFVLFSIRAFLLLKEDRY